MTDALPQWPHGTVAVLVTSAAAGLGAIPVSTGVRLDETRIGFGLSGRRASLAKLIESPQVAWTIMCEGVAVTAFGSAHVVDPLPGVDGMVGVVIDVERIQDHASRRFEMTSGVGWHWTDEESAKRDTDVRAAVASLAGR